MIDVRMLNFTLETQEKENTIESLYASQYEIYLRVCSAKSHFHDLLYDTFTACIFQIGKNDFKSTNHFGI